MFRVTRRAEPSWMRSPEFELLRRDLTAFHLAGGTRGASKRFLLVDRLAPFADRLHDALNAQFGALCAYTEVRGSADMPLRLVWHRPTNDAARLDGTIDQEHYWWLSLEWANWYLASARVESVKSYQFPVAGPRTAVDIPVEGRQLDRGLLIDPCAEEPAWWLRFDSSGQVTARNAGLDPAVTEDRGELTIRVLDLSDAALVETRRAEIRELRDFLRVRSDPRTAIARLLDEKADPLPHRGATLQTLIRQGLKSSSPEHVRADIVPMLTTQAPEVLGAELFDSTLSLDDLREIASDRAIDGLRRRLVKARPQLTGHPTFARLFETARPVAAAIPTNPKPTPPALTIGPTDRIRRVLIRDFRAIHEVEFEVQTEMVLLPDRLDAPTVAPVEGTQWKALLGENGSGKSSILHAIALALSGDQLDAMRATAGFAWSDVMRRDSARRFGRVLLEFTGGQRIDLRFNRHTAWFHGLAGGAPVMNVNVRAYGATRLLRKTPPKLMADARGASDAVALLDAVRVLADPNAELVGRQEAAVAAANLVAEYKAELTDAQNLRSQTSVDVSNLLDSSVPVTDASGWLLELDESGTFNVAAIALGDLLGPPSQIASATNQKFSNGSRHSEPGATTTRRIELRGNPGEKKVFVDDDSLEHVSDGYRSVIAMVCDIMSGIGGLQSSTGGVSDFARARGIVLIDEVGAHLHPRWRMQITDRLRRVFPNVQFIVSTHEPLCLRGLVENEVIRVCKYEEHGVLLYEPERSPARYRVDQLLTSEFFGLDSAIDPDVDRKFEEYYELKRSRRLDEAGTRRLHELDAELNGRLRPTLGSTRRDQLIYEAVDNFLLAEPTLKPAPRVGVGTG